MNSKSKQEIRNAVRKTYATIAKGNGAATDKNRSATCSDTIGTPSSASQVLSCCGPSNMSAEEGASELCGCVPPDVSAEQMSTIMGYTQEDIKGVPEGANMGLGCGNPVA